MTEALNTEDNVIRIAVADAQPDETVLTLHRGATAVDLFVNEDDEIIAISLHLNDKEENDDQ